jgi:hypothetical protein
MTSLAAVAVFSTAVKKPGGFSSPGVANRSSWEYRIPFDYQVRFVLIHTYFFNPVSTIVSQISQIRFTASGIPV